MSDGVSLKTAVVWTVIPFLNFVIWFHLGQHHSGCSAPSSSPQLTHIGAGGRTKVVYNYSECSKYGLVAQAPPSSLSGHGGIPPFISSSMTDSYHFGRLKMSQFEEYKKDELVHLKSSAATMYELNFHGTPCKTYVQTLTESKPFTSLAIVLSSNTVGSLNMLRYNKDQKKTGRVYDKAHPVPTGIFRNVANKKGRISQRSYTEPFLKNLDIVEGEIMAMMKKRELGPGSDVTLMVTNDGEIDLFLNYACSCRGHNISLNNAIVFTGSSELVSVVRATGAMGYYHPSFTNVPRKASGGYLDKVFVMMMWYKAFSLHVMLRMGFNVLFQDVDLVWFRNPFEHLHENMKNEKGEFEYEAYLSDDGARAIRYSPFFANSGFYYLRSTESTRSFSYSVMLAFDILHATGSHQNVFTFRLLENMELFPTTKKKFLKLSEFPSGVKYHHDKQYMKRVVDGSAHPYIFHMCWTSNKKQKLENFAKVKMWYLQDHCNHDTLAPEASNKKRLYDQLAAKFPHDKEDGGADPRIFNALAQECCRFEGNL